MQPMQSSCVMIGIVLPHFKSNNPGKMSKEFKNISAKTQLSVMLLFPTSYYTLLCDMEVGGCKLHFCFVRVLPVWFCQLEK